MEIKIKGHNECKKYLWRMRKESKDDNANVKMDVKLELNLSITAIII